MSSPQNIELETIPAEETSLTEAEIEEAPWKYIGYKGYSRFISSEDDFFLLRRFDTLNVRVALVLQDEIASLEEKLNELDKEYSEKTAEDYNNSTIRGDVEDRSELLEEICNKLPKYSTAPSALRYPNSMADRSDIADEFLIQQTTLKKYPRAPQHNVKSMQTWHSNHQNAIAADESKYLDYGSDLIAVSHREKTPLRRVLDSSLRVRTLPLWRHREDDVPGYDKGHVSYYSDKRIDRFASAIIIATGVLMLITPIWILQAAKHATSKLAVITIFIFIFLLVLSLAMVAKPFEALGATAAYDYLCRQIPSSMANASIDTRQY
ncbi:hypothetical protein CSAL01_07648 [Colletotrichum salicis]|uniref:DUF6594 domain-containing protein n=1 Tax=Colletotrichum salicis TaxID=1209931 RepID=A0A135UMU4_9PEZI|nr:hypothetical protein CSAL01_07648 [Colletotrichum salicis]